MPILLGQSDQQTSFVPAIAAFLAAFIILSVRELPCAGQVADREPPQLVVQTGPVGEVSTMAFSPDGRWLASGSRDHIISIWDVATGHLLRKLEGHTAKVNSLAFSPDGKLLASGSDDHFTILWDGASGKAKRRFAAPAGEIYHVAFSSDGQWLASGSGEGIALWDVSSGKLLQGFGYEVLKGHLLGFTPDGHSLIIEGDARIATWSLTHEILTWEMSIEKGEPRRILATSGDGRLLALQDSDSNIDIRDARANQEVSKISSEAVGLRNPAAFSPDRKILACQSDRKDHAVRLWDVASGSELRALGNSLSSALAFSPDGRKLAVAYTTISIWDVASGSLLQEMKRNVERPLRIHISKINGKYGPVLLADSGRNFLHVWDLRSPPSLERYDSSTSADFIDRPDGNVVITDWRDGKRQFIDALTGAKLAWRVELPLSTEWVTSPDATFVAITERARNEQAQVPIHVKEVVTGREVKSFVSRTQDVGTMAFSNDNRWLLTKSFFNRSADLWDLSSGESEHHFEGEDVVLSPDGRWVASCSSGAGIIVLDLHTEVERTFSGNCGVTFSAGGRYLATGHDGPIDVWEMQSGRHVLSLELSGTTGGKFFSQDERYLVTSTTLKEEQIWELSTGHEVLPTFSRLIHQWPSVGFLEDSHWLVATAADGSIKIWDVDAEKLIASLYVLNDGESWLVTTPDGYFDGGDTAVKKLVTWNVGDEIYPAARFAKKCYRPGLLADIFAKTEQRP